MESNRDQGGPGISRWAEPWNPGWTKMAAHPAARTQPHVLPTGSERRIKRVGMAASSLAALVWCAAIVWLWPLVA